MASRVEAHSLQAVIDLACNPPSEPGIHTHGHPTTLELYIIRVPGSRDVFLTPLKPRDRIVNAQDVQSSLYFLHVDSADEHLSSLVDQSYAQDDRTLRDELLSSEFLKREAASSTSFRRKPLPTPPASPVEQQHGFTFPQKDVPPHHTVVPRRKPVASSTIHSESQAAPTSVSQHSFQHGVFSAQGGQQLTLIRRDASTGKQWNVAKIRDPPVDEISSDHSNASGTRVKTAGAPLYLDILNEEYAKFAPCPMGQDTRPSMDGEDTGRRSSSDDHHCTASRDVLTPQSPLSVLGPPLSRRVWLPSSKHADHSYISQHRPRALRPSSVDGRGKSYAFHDAWGQTCEFSTAITGRALRCRRRRHGRVGDDSMDCGEEEDVSELRFNLPTYHAKTRSETTVPFSSSSSSSSSALTSLTSASSPPHHHRGVGAGTAAAAVERDEVITTDYTLGRERLGGGFGGREAKLGKLVLRPAGLEMLDLVVAANMALWWRAYERTRHV